MTRRQSIDIPGFAHVNPVPAASRIGQFVFSGVLVGRDPTTSEMPVTLAHQVEQIFERMRELMQAAGGSLDDIIKVTFWVAEYRERDEINREWLTAFPDPAARPARQVMAAHLDGGALVHADIVAILGDLPKGNG